MITRVEASNLFSIDHCDVSFEKAKYKYLNQFNIEEKVANPIAVYGRNGSGKSSFLYILRQLVDMLVSHPDNLIPIIPNFVNDENMPSYIKVYFEVNGNNYIYYIRTNLNKILNEVLTKDNDELLNRKDNVYIVSGKEYQITANYYPALRDYANKNNDTDINIAFDYLSNIAFIGADKSTYIARTLNNVNHLDMMVNKSNDVKEILKKYEAFPIYDIISIMNNDSRTKDYYAAIQKENGGFMVPYKLISNGMKNQSFMLSILLSLPENGVMVVDELEDALHPLTIMNFINLAIERKIQLIFVSHNTNTLSQLRPDNVIFANWSDGYSSYKRLCDIYPNIREVNNIEKMYLSSVFDEEIEK